MRDAYFWLAETVLVVRFPSENKIQAYTLTQQHSNKSQNNREISARNRSLPCDHLTTRAISKGFRRNTYDGFAFVVSSIKWIYFAIFLNDIDDSPSTATVTCVLEGGGWTCWCVSILLCTDPFLFSRMENRCCLICRLDIFCLSFPWRWSCL